MGRTSHDLASTDWSKPLYAGQAVRVSPAYTAGAFKGLQSMLFLIKSKTQNIWCGLNA